MKTNQDITYTAFNKVKIIEQGDYRMSFVYGHDYARRKTNLYKNGSKVMTKYFVGNYEQKEMGSKVHKISYIMGGDGLAAIHMMGKSGPDLLYVHKDYLGSIQCLCCDNTDRNYGIVEEYSYDAWGKKTYPDEPGYNNDYSYADLCRGYTGHEHLPEFGLINMNGRLYDPLLGRFLSPDNYVQMPDFTQNFNRFGYCLNNPLIYSDPSGNAFVLDDLLIAAAIGAVMNTAMQGMSGNINSGGDFFKAMGIGALAGAAGYGAGVLASGGLTFTGSLGNAMANGAIVGAASGFAAGFVGGAGNAWANGSNFGTGLGQGFIGGGIGMTTGAFVGGIFGAINYGIKRKEFAPISRDNTIETNKDGSLKPSTETLNKFSDKAFPKYKYRKNANLIYKEGYVESIDPTYGAFTDPKAKNGVYDIYFSKNSFNSKWRLFLDMGHEYNHIAHLITLGNNWARAYSENAAYKWNYLVSKDEYYLKMSNKYFNTSILKNKPILNNLIRPKYMQYGNWGLFTTVPKFIYK